MTYVYGALAGLVWGAAFAALNGFISLRAIRKSSNKAILGANLLRLLLDVVALGTVFLLRNVLPFSMETALVGTALSLSTIGIVFAFRVAGGKIK